MQGAHFPQIYYLKHHVCALEVLRLALGAGLFVFFQPGTSVRDSLDPHRYMLLSLNKKKTDWVVGLGCRQTSKGEEHLHLPETVGARSNSDLWCSQEGEHVKFCWHFDNRPHLHPKPYNLWDHWKKFRFSHGIHLTFYVYTPLPLCFYTQMHTFQGGSAE